MAFNLDTVYGFGSGKLQDITISGGATDKINSYARITAVGTNSITINRDSCREGDFEKFEQGADLLLHISASKGATAKLGDWLAAKIISVTGDTLLLDKDFSSVITNLELEHYFAQAITFANFDCLNLRSGGIIAPPIYSPYDYFGGILAVKCFDTLNIDGGFISLADSGIPATRRNTLRPYTEGDKFYLNSPHGAAFIVAKNFKGGGFDVQPKGLGGASVIIATENFIEDKPVEYALFPRKENNVEVGKGFGYCYIASPTHGDIISDKFRLREQLGLKDFGRGIYNAIKPDFKLNNVGKVGVTVDNHQRLLLLDKTTDGLAAIQEGSYICAKGNFYRNFARILKVDGDYIYTDAPVQNDFVAMAEFENLTVKNYSDENFCVLVTDTCDLRGANITADFVTIAAKNLILDDCNIDCKDICIISDGQWLVKSC